MTNASGSWSTASKINEWGGWGSEMIIDANDDIFIPNIAVTGPNKVQLTTVEGSGQGLTARPIYDISPMLPDGLTMNWRNGTISGTPTEVLANTTFTVTVAALGTTTTATFTLYVTGAPGDISYSDISGAKGTTITSAIPTITSNGTTGSVTSWAISATLPSGLTFESSNGTIWGTPTVELSLTTYTVWANNSVGSSSTTVNITIGPMVPGPFEYNPENNTLTNNTYVHLEPDFINITTGNGSTWSTTPTGYQLTTSFHGDVPCLNQTYNGTIYASYNAKLHGYGIANNTLWLINNTIESVGCDTYFSWPSSTGYTQSVSHSYGTSLYFTGLDGSDRNLYGYGMENGTIWVESTADPGMWSMMVDDVMYFFGETGNSGYELHGHNLSNGTTWMLDDLFSGSGSVTGPTLTNNWPVLVGSTFVFGAVISSTSRETWAHNISNGTSWRLSTNDASTHNAPVIGDVVYFTNKNCCGWNELHAYNASNETFWKVVAGPFGGPFEVDGILYGYVRSPYSSQPSKLRAHNPANGTTWDAAVPGPLDLLNMGGTLYYAGSPTGTNNRQLWAYEPTNSTGWKVSDLTIPFSAGMNRVFIALGDVIYFTASNGTTSGLWAHSSSNHSTWFVSNLFSSNNAAAVAVVNGTLYLGNSGMAGHQPASINYQTNTGGAVTSWAINASLPSGLTFSTTNGSIYGTPTELWTQTSYMVWANNSGGSDNATVNITVNDEVPDISYNPDWFVLTNNTAMSPTATPTNAGGAIPSGIIAEPLQVGSSYGEGRSTSIAVDSNGVAHVVYFGGYHYQTLYYATNANGSWVTTMIKNQQGSSSGASIVIDANDTIHISYSHRASRFSMSNNLYYSTCSSSCSSAFSWSGVLVESGSGLHNDIAIDTNGTLHISHLTSGSIGSSLQHSTCSSSCTSSSSWTTTSILTSATNVISSISMTTDSNNSIHILYREGYGYPTFDLNYATCSSGCTSASSWSTVEIDASTTSSYMSKQSIAVDSNNGIHITYGLNGNLTYATCSSSCTSASSWTNTTVDTGSFNGVGEIALDSNEHLYISYGKGSSFAASKLAYATCSSSCTSSSSWTNTTFNTTAGTVRGLALDSNDRVHISYHTSSTDKLLRYLAIEPSSIVYGYSISPALPAGLSLEISTGEISGTPTELSTNTTYTITVRNSGGVNTTTITIEVVDQVPTVAYSPADLTLTNNTVSSDLPLSPTITGSGEFVTWAISPSEPSGLSFDVSTGTLSGTPVLALHAPWCCRGDQHRWKCNSVHQHHNC
ncbi:MAG: conserved putative subtilisin peptidase [uncultured Candidatus Poseidoniales archaeon]|nr:MAG: conserved putative subtilisin peptidase [uncultured Candidatus Poseidoniales archaeon]